MYYDEPTQPVQYRPPQEKGKSRRGFGCLGRVFLGSLLLVMLVVFTGVVITGTLIYANLSREIEAGITALDAARDRETFETTQIVDRNGTLLWEIFGEGKRTNVPLDSIPLELRNATVAVEDDTFYENIGLD